MSKLCRILREERIAREAEERQRREEEARTMAEEQRRRDEAQRLQEEKEAQERAKAEQEENIRLQKQVRSLSMPHTKEADKQAHLERMLFKAQDNAAINTYTSHTAAALFCPLVAFDRIELVAKRSRMMVLKILKINIIII